MLGVSRCSASPLTEILQVFFLRVDPKIFNSYRIKFNLMRTIDKGHIYSATIIKNYTNIIIIIHR